MKLNGALKPRHGAFSSPFASYFSTKKTTNNNNNNNKNFCCIRGRSSFGAAKRQLRKKYRDKEVQLQRYQHPTTTTITSRRTANKVIRTTTTTATTKTFLLFNKDKRQHHHDVVDVKDNNYNEVSDDDDNDHDDDDDDEDDNDDVVVANHDNDNVADDDDDDVVNNSRNDNYDGVNNQENNPFKQEYHPQLDQQQQQQQQQQLNNESLSLSLSLSPSLSLTRTQQQQKSFQQSGNETKSLIFQQQQGHSAQQHNQKSLTWTTTLTQNRIIKSTTKAITATTTTTTINHDRNVTIEEITKKVSNNHEEAEEAEDLQVKQIIIATRQGFSNNKNNKNNNNNNKKTNINKQDSKVENSYTIKETKEIKDQHPLAIDKSLGSSLSCNSGFVVPPSIEGKLSSIYVLFAFLTSSLLIQFSIFKNFLKFCHFHLRQQIQIYLMFFTNFEFPAESSKGLICMVSSIMMRVPQSFCSRNVSKSRSRSTFGSMVALLTNGGGGGGPPITTTTRLRRRSSPPTRMLASSSSSSGGRRAAGLYWLLVYSAAAATLLLPQSTLADDGDTFFSPNGIAVAETTTAEFDYASRGQKKFGDKCDNTLECGFPGSVCDAKKKSCRCTDDLPITNHIDKCGKGATVNESCFFNEQCESVYLQTECRDGRCVCRFDMAPIWLKDGSVECKGRGGEKPPEKYIDPAMIGVLIGMALMFVIICVVLRLFSQARWHENRTIFNTPNPRLMNVSLLRESKLLHGQERRGSRMSVRAPSRQPSMASLRPHSPNPSLGKTGSRSNSNSNASATSLKSTRSNSVSPAVNNTHHERKSSTYHPHPHPHPHHQQQQQQQQHAHAHHHQQPQHGTPQVHPQNLLIAPNAGGGITPMTSQATTPNITTNPVAENVTVEIIAPEK